MGHCNGNIAIFQADLRSIYIAPVNSAFFKQQSSLKQLYIYSKNGQYWPIELDDMVKKFYWCCSHDQICM